MTAQKRDEYINSVPMAISTYRGVELKELGVTDTRDLGNEFYRTSVIQLGDSEFAYTGMTRIYGVSLNYEFR